MKIAKTVLVLLFAAFSCTSLLAQENEKPNILVIWGDDIGWSNPSIYNMGMMGYKTPNMDVSRLLWKKLT